MVRTDTNGSWITDGYKVGETIVVSNSAANSNTAATPYTVTAVSAKTLTLSAADAIVAEASSLSPETVTVTGTSTSAPVYFTAGQNVTSTVQGAYFVTGGSLGAAQAAEFVLAGLSYTFDSQYGSNPAIVREDGGSWITDGFVAGQQILVSGSANNSNSAANPYTIVKVTATSLILANSTHISVDNQPDTLTVATTSGTITRTDSGSFIDAGFQAGQMITVAGSTDNSTAVSTTQSVTITASSAPIATMAYFTASNVHPGTIVRTDGGSWSADGLSVGMAIIVGGSVANSSSVASPYHINTISADGSTLTLSSQEAVAAVGSALAPEAITVATAAQAA